MSMSFDPRQFQLVSDFAALLETLKDPKDFLKSIQDARDVVEEQKTLLGPLATKESADFYLEEAKKKYEQSKVDAEAAKVALQDEADKAKAKKQAAQDKVDAKQAELDALLQATKELHQSALQDADAAKAALYVAEKATEANNQRSTDLDAREAVLADKAEQLKKLLG
jgi:hypothetical protein